MSGSKTLASAALALAGLGAMAAAHAAGGDVGQAAKQSTNWTAIVMFGLFVAGTLWITKWAAAKTRSAADFYTAGGGITGFQNGLAIAGDYMSAASFLGISAAVMASGYDGLIYSIGFLVGWPILTFLLAERLRNLGKFTFADVAGYRFAQTPFRAFAASGTLVVVAFYLIAQMVGAGQLIKLLFGLDYWIAVVLVGALMMIYVLFGGMTATTWVQIIKAVMLLAGVSFMGFMIMARYGFSFEALFADGVRVRTEIASNSGKSCVREAEHRLHGLAGLCRGRFGQLPAAAAVGAVEGLHDQGRGDRRLPGPDLLGGPDRRLAPGLGSHAGPSQGLGLVPLHLAGAVLHGHRLCRRVAVLGARQERPGRQGARSPPRAAGALGTGLGASGASGH